MVARLSTRASTASASRRGAPRAAHGGSRSTRTRTARRPPRSSSSRSPRPRSSARRRPSSRCTRRAARPGSCSTRATASRTPCPSTRASRCRTPSAAWTSRAATSRSTSCCCCGAPVRAAAVSARARARARQRTARERARSPRARARHDATPPRAAAATLATSAERDFARQVKEDCCCVAFNPTKEEEHAAQPGTYRLPDGTTIPIGPERFRAPEVLFRPELVGSEARGAHKRASARDPARRPRPAQDALLVDGARGRLGARARRPPAQRGAQALAEGRQDPHRRAARAHLLGVDRRLDPRVARDLQTVGQRWASTTSRARARSIGVHS